MLPNLLSVAIGHRLLRQGGCQSSVGCQDDDVDAAEPAFDRLQSRERASYACRHRIVPQPMAVIEDLEIWRRSKVADELLRIERPIGIFKRTHSLLDRLIGYD